MIFLPEDPEVLVKSSTEFKVTEGTIVAYSVYTILFLRLITGLSTFLVVVISIITFSKVQLIDNLPPSLYAINSSTAMLFALCGVCLLLLQNFPAKNKFFYLLSFVFDLVIIFLSLIPLSGLKFAADLQDPAPIVNILNFLYSIDIFRQTQIDSLSFILLAVSLLIFPISRLRKLSQFFSLLIFVFYGVILLAQLFGVSNLHLVLMNPPSVPWVSLGFVILSLADIFIRPEDGLTSILVKESFGGVMLRRLLPLLVISLSFGGYIILRVEWGYLFGPAYSLFLLVTWGLAFMFFSAWAIAVYLDKLEKEKVKMRNLSEPRQQFVAYSLASEKSRLELETKNRNIKDSQDRLKNVFASSPNLVFIKNSQGFFEFVNKRFETVFKVDSSSILGKTGFGFLPQEVSDGWSQNDRAILDLGKTVSLEQKVRQDDGLNHTYFVTKFPLLDDSGRPKAICGIGTDITDIKEYQSHLIQEKIKEEAILNSVGDGIVALDSEGKLLLMNSSCSAMTGFSTADLANSTWTQVVNMADEDGKIVDVNSRPMTQALVEKSRVVSSDFYYIRKDGTRFPVSIIVTPMIFDGRVAGVVEAFRDVTKEKQLERAKDEFVSMVSHELKAPMTSVQGGLAVILKGDYGALSEELKPILSRMLEYVGRLLNLVEDILKVSKIESGALKVTFVKVSLDPVVTEVCTNLKVLADKKNIQLNKGEISSKEVSGDPVLITEIVTNIINNSIKFTETGGVAVYAREDGSLLNLYVQDTGVGIPKDEQAKLFGKFQQISTSSGRPAGTGLGLYLSKGMAQSMGGDLKLSDSIVGKGSTFVLSLPLAS